MNILLINHYAGSTSHGMEYRPFYLARQWVAAGHEATIVAGSRSHLRIEEPRVEGAMTEETIEGIRYLWLKTPAYRGNGVRRVLNMLAFEAQLRRHSARIVRALRPDAVIASSPHPLMIFSAARIARKAGAKLVFEVRDIWPLTLVELGSMSPRHPFLAILQYAENYAYRHADRVVSLLPKADVHMREHGMAEHKFACIPNGADVAQWQADVGALPEEHGRALADLARQGRFLVGYAGGHGISNALDHLVDSAELLRAQPITLVLVGQGPEKDRLQEKAQHRGAANVVFLPPVPKSSVPALLQRMDALYLGWQKNPLYRFGISPNKLLDYMMAAKPVVHAVEAGNDLVAESGCGISCEPENPRAIADAILELAGCSAEDRAAMGRRGRDFVMLHHDYPVLARQFLDLMK